MLHILGLPHTRISKSFSCCAFTQKILKFTKMMNMIWMEYTVYAPWGWDIDVVDCLPSEKREEIFKGNVNDAMYDWNNKIWRWVFTKNAIEEINGRKQKWDLLLVSYWLLQKDIIDWTWLPTMELGIWYEGVCPNTYKVRESYARKNFISWKYNLSPNDYDAVIPNYFDLRDFPDVKYEKKDYICFVGRLNHDKWVQIAVDVAKKYWVKCLVAGQLGNWNIDPYAEYVWVVDFEQRAKLMWEAKAVFVPSQYHEPFWGVAVEALLCWTPIITSDNWWLQEINRHGITWFRCRSFKDYCRAFGNLDIIDPEISNSARQYFSLESIAPLYKKQIEKVIDHINGWSWYS